MKRLHFLLVLLAVGCSRDPFASAASDLPKAVAEAKVAGLPTTPDDLVRNVADAENAAVEYRKAIALVASIQPESPSNWVTATEMPSLGTGRRCSEPEMAKLKERVQKYSRIFVLVDKAATKKHCDFEREYGEGMNVMFPEFARLKDFAKANSARALLAAHQGNAALCEKGLRAIFGVAWHCGEDPFLIGQLVALAAGKIGLRAVEDVLVECGANPRIVAACNAALRSAPKSFNLISAMGGELVMSDVQLSKLVKKGDGTNTYGIEDLAQLSGGLSSKQKAQKEQAVNADLATVKKAFRAKTMRYFASIAQNGKGKNTAEITRIMQEVGDKLQKSTEPADLGCGLMTPIIFQTGVALRTYEYKLQSTQAGLAMLSQKRSQFPASNAPLPAGVATLVKKNGLAYRQTLGGFEIDAASFEIETTNTINVGVTGFQYPRMKRS